MKKIQLFPIALRPELAKKLALVHSPNLKTTAIEFDLKFTALLSETNTVTISFVKPSRRDDEKVVIKSSDLPGLLTGDEFEKLVSEEKHRLAEAEYYRREEIRVAAEIKKVQNELFPESHHV